MRKSGKQRQQSPVRLTCLSRGVSEGVQNGFWRSQRGRRELKELKERFPSLCFELQGDSAFVTGVLNVTPDIGYTTTLEIPRGYPRELPILHCNRIEIPWELNRHVITTNGYACLCARSEYRLHWPETCSLSDFIERLVKPFFLGQFYYDTHGCWPPTGERSHGWKGIVEAYVELCAPLSDTSLDTIIRVMQLLSRKNDPQGHEFCPCGSGLKLRHCHSELLAKLRRCVRPKDATVDLAHLLYFRQQKEAGGAAS
jgi:hypothetical protein